jgi:hypothetical protein
VDDQKTNENYITLATDGGYCLSQGEYVDLKFVPFYFRANRGGKGQMRVGLKRYSEALRDKWSKVSTS